MFSLFYRLPDAAVASCETSTWNPITSEDFSLLTLQLPLPLGLEGTVAKRPEDIDNSFKEIQRL